MEAIIHDLLRRSVYENDESLRLQNMARVIKILSQILPQDDVDEIIFNNKDTLQYIILSEAIIPQSISLIIEALIKNFNPDVHLMKNFWEALDYIASIDDQKDASYYSLNPDQQQKAQKKIPHKFKEILHQQEYCDVIQSNLIKLKINSLNYSMLMVEKMLKDLDNVINYGHEINILNVYKNYLQYSVEDTLIIKVCNILEMLKKRWPSLWFNSNLDFMIEEILMSKQKYFFQAIRKTHHNIVIISSNQNDQPSLNNDNLSNISDEPHSKTISEKKNRKSIMHSIKTIKKEDQNDEQYNSNDSQCEMDNSDQLKTEDSQEYEVDEKNNIIIDSRIKFFLISLENWLFDSAKDEESPQIYKEPYIADFFKLQENLDFFLTLIIFPTIYKASANYMQNLERLTQQEQKELVYENLKIVEKYKEKLKYQHLDFSEYFNHLVYFMKRSYYAAEVLLDYRNYRFLIKKIPKLPYLIIEYFSQSLIEDDRIQNVNHTCRIVKKYIKYEFKTIYNIINKHLLFQLIPYIDFEYVQQLLMFMLLPQKIKRELDEIDSKNTFLINVIDQEFYEQIGRYLRFFNFFQQIVENMLHISNPQKIADILKKQSFFISNNANELQIIVQDLQNLSNQEKYQKLNKVYISQQRFQEQYTQNKVTKILFEEQQNFIVDIDDIKKTVLTTNAEQVANNFSKVKNSIKLINKAKLFSLGGVTKLNENQKDKFFNQQKQLKSELVQQRQLKLNPITRKSMNPYDHILEMRRNSSSSQISHLRQSLPIADTSEILRELKEQENKTQDIYKNFDYTFEKFFLIEIVRQKNNNIKVDLIQNSLLIQKQLATVDQSDMAKSTSRNFRVRNNSVSETAKQNKKNIAQMKQKAREEERVLLKTQLLNNAANNLEQQQQTFTKNKAKAEFIIKKIDLHHDLKSFGVLQKVTDVKQIDQNLFQEIITSYQFSGLYQLNRGFFDETDIDHFYKNKEFSNYNLIKTEKYAQECAILLQNIFEFIISNSLDFNNFKSKLSIQQYDMKYLTDAIFLNNQTENLFFDRILKNFLYKYKLCFEEQFQINNSSIICGHIVNNIITNIDKVIFKDYKEQILITCYEHFQFFQKVIILSFGQVSEEQQKPISFHLLQLIEIFQKFINIINENKQIIEKGLKEKKQKNEEKDIRCNNSILNSRKKEQRVDKKVFIYDEIFDVVWDILIQHFARYYSNNIFQNCFQQIIGYFCRFATENQLINVIIKLNLFGVTSKIFQFIFLNKIAISELKCETINLSVRNIYTHILQAVNQRKFYRLSQQLSSIQIFNQICTTYKLNVSLQNSTTKSHYTFDNTVKLQIFTSRKIKEIQSPTLQSKQNT